MTDEKRFAVVDVAELKWPNSTRILSKRFRLFVAADTKQLGTDVISAFASVALGSGMVYLCAWGPGCERFHDIVDQVEIETASRTDDVVMTTWHDRDTLEEALDFFATCAVPCDGFLPDSDFRLVICLNGAEWAQAAKRFLESAEYFV